MRFKKDKTNYSSTYHHKKAILVLSTMTIFLTFWLLLDVENLFTYFIIVSVGVHSDIYQTSYKIS
jgi:hypothetical protein